jgi:LysM repeat protein
MVVRAAVLSSLLTIVISVFSFSTALLSGASGSDTKVSTPTFRVITVPAGATLWAIAAQVVKPGSDVRDVVDQLVELNHLDSMLVQAGQRLTIPL